MTAIRGAPRSKQARFLSIAHLASVVHFLRILVSNPRFWLERERCESIRTKEEREAETCDRDLYEKLFNCWKQLHFINFFHLVYQLVKLICWIKFLSFFLFFSKTNLYPISIYTCKIYDALIKLLKKLWRREHTCAT